MTPSSRQEKPNDVGRVMQTWWQKIVDRWPIGLAFAFGAFATQWISHMELGGHPEMDRRMSHVEQRLTIVETQMRYYHPQVLGKRKEHP